MFFHIYYKIAHKLGEKALDPGLKLTLVRKSFLKRKYSKNGTRLLIALLPLFCSVCGQVSDPALGLKLEVFEQEAESIRSLLQTPALNLGLLEGDSLIYTAALGEDSRKSSPTPQIQRLFPLASISKTFASVLLFQYIESGQVKLDEPLKKYLPKAQVPSSVRIKEVISHCSEGTQIGSFFEYSSRYGLIGELLEKLSAQDYEDLMERKILAKLGLHHTIPGLGAKDYQALSAKMIRPFQLSKQGNIVPGKLPSPGLKSSTGLASTIEDLALYSRALDQNLLISEESKREMWSPYITAQGDTLPYAKGWFTQKVRGHWIYWHYGLEECFSTVLMKIPSKNLSFIMLANTSILSEHGQMLSGDFTTSLLFQSLLRNIIFPELAPPTMPALGTGVQDWERSLEKADSLEASFYFEEIRSRLMAYHFLDHKGLEQKSELATLIHILLKYFHRELIQNADIQFAYTLTELLKDRHYELISVADKFFEKLSQATNLSPSGLSLLGEYFRVIGEKDRAREYFTRVAEVENYKLRGFWLMANFYAGELWKEKDPLRAKKYFQKVNSIAWNINGILTKSREYLRALP